MPGVLDRSPNNHSAIPSPHLNSFLPPACAHAHLTYIRTQNIIITQRTLSWHVFDMSVLPISRNIFSAALALGWGEKTGWAQLNQTLLISQISCLVMNSISIIDHQPSTYIWPSKPFHPAEQSCGGHPSPFPAKSRYQNPETSSNNHRDRRRKQPPAWSYLSSKLQREYYQLLCISICFCPALLYPPRVLVPPPVPVPVPVPVPPVSEST